MTVKPQDVIIWLIVAAIIVVAILILNNYIKKKKDEPGSAPGEAQDDAKELSKKLKQTFQNSQYASFADSIHEALKYDEKSVSAWEDNPKIAEDILKEMQNDLDIAKLIDAYGLREEQFLGFGTGKKSLFETITANFKSSRKQSVNMDWSTKPITYRL
ncbi:hypothetical protein QQ054_01065 [Oscillatoria amoena NRMC-F 0135]|nr:hypothetical protein [Oscillatoria amoena NRMC-F 0135]